MKSSLIGFLPWNKRFGSSTCEITPNTTSITYSNSPSVEFDNMKDKSCPRVNLHPQKRQRKMTPLLRLDSAGEICTGNDFCNRSVDSQQIHHKKLQFSNSFDSSSLPSTSASKSFLGRNSEICDLGCSNIPTCPSFNQSQPIPANNSKMPTHQSFPPPASSLHALKSNGFSCPLTQTFSLYSTSPRLLGSPSVFRTSPTMQCKCVTSTTPCDNKDVNSPISMNVKKIQSDDLNFSKQNLLKSKSSTMCNNDNLGSSDITKLDTVENGNADRSITVDLPHVDDSSQSSFNCSETKVKDSSDVVPMRKTKKRRPRNKRRRRKKQDDIFTPSSCSSPVANTRTSNSDTSKTCKISNNVSQIINQCKSMKKSQSAIGKSSLPSKPHLVSSKFMCLASSDSDHSLDEHCLSDDDSIFECSIVSCDDKSASISNSKKAKKRRKCKETRGLKSQSCSNPGLDIPGQKVSIVESEGEQNSSHSGLHLTFVSLNISEDDENDSSVDWDCSASPSTSDPFIFEFDFNTGLSIEAIIGQSSASSTDSGNSKELRDLNAKWYKFYASDSSDDCVFQGDPKVHFASDEDLVTVHLVGDEHRGGDWHLYALDRLRFEHRIEDVEKVLAPILTESHRAKVFARMN